MIKKYILKVAYDDKTKDMRIKGNVPPEMIKDVSTVVMNGAKDCKRVKKKTEICLPKFEV